MCYQHIISVKTFHEKNENLALKHKHCEWWIVAHYSFDLYSYRNIFVSSLWLFLIDVWLRYFRLIQWESYIDWWVRLCLLRYNLTTDLFMSLSVHRIGQASRSSSAPCLHFRSVWRYVYKCLHFKACTDGKGPLSNETFIIYKLLCSYWCFIKQSLSRAVTQNSGQIYQRTPGFYIRDMYSWSLTL